MFNISPSINIDQALFPRDFFSPWEDMEAKWQRPPLEPPDDPGEDWFLWYDRFLSFPPNAQGKRIVPPDYVMMDGYKLGARKNALRDSCGCIVLLQLRVLLRLTRAILCRLDPSAKARCPCSILAHASFSYASRPCACHRRLAAAATDGSAEEDAERCARRSAGLGGYGVEPAGGLLGARFCPL